MGRNIKVIGYKVASTIFSEGMARNCNDLS